MIMEYSKGWLQYKRLSDENKGAVELCCNRKSPIIDNAITELTNAFMGFYGRQLIIREGENSRNDSEVSVILRLDTCDDSTRKAGDLSIDDVSDNSKGKTYDSSAGYTSKKGYDKEGYRILCVKGKCTVSAYSDQGLLYGTFALLRRLSSDNVTNFETWSYEEEKSPSNPLRILNHWDNMDGSIERGYSGRSFFFEEDDLIVNDRTKDYARLAASVGINAVVINNVNVKEAATELISDRFYGKLARLSQVFTSYGIKLFLSINYAAPMELGGLDTADPCDSRVGSWWMKKAEEIWNKIPELGGFLVKADSEGRPGPFTYHRTHADGANMLAEAVKPFGGLVIWRCFVYNCQQDWRDTKTDRARAGYDNFMPLDGTFAENVILQIKNGPMDFQVREPVSPLFGGLRKTNMILEVQIAQEYTGQQRHVCYLIPWFKKILAFRTYCGSDQDRISDIVSGRTYANLNCGMAAVCNTGNDYNWTGHELAAANWYGFGRLSFDTELTAKEIAREWISQTYGHETKVQENILKILMMSWPTYEKYTSPLGIGWMVKPNHHYGPDVDGYEYDRWGTYHKANHKGIGVDRTEKGTGFCKQYNEPLSTIYADRKTCPEELLLFFHHMEYDYVLSSGKTILQHIYDTHFEGADEAELFLTLWQELEGLLNEGVYQRALVRFQHQKDHAREWCDVINSCFYRKTGVEDQYQRPIY